MRFAAICSVLVIAGASLGVARPAARSPHRSTTGSCYVDMVVIVWDGDTTVWRMRRVVTSGIRVFADAGRGAPNWCTPTDASAIPMLQAAVAARLDAAPAAHGARIDRMLVRGTSLRFMRAALLHVEASARSHPPFRWMEIAAPPDGRGAPEMPLRDTSSDDRVCAAANDSLAMQHADYRWAC